MARIKWKTGNPACLACLAVFVAFAARAEDGAEIAKGLDNLKRIYAIAQIIEMRNALGGDEPPFESQLDPWGTPYRIETPFGYRIIGAGRDKRFELSSVKPSVQFAGLDDDVVFQNGAMVRSNRNWLHARVTPGAAATALAALRQEELLFMMMRAPVMQKIAGINLTGLSMRDVGALIENHRAVHGDLSRLTPPDQRDAWGTPLRVIVEGESWRVISAGSDRKFDPTSWRTSARADPAEDMIFERGIFTRRVAEAELLKVSPPETKPIAQPPDEKIGGVGPWKEVDKSMTPPQIVQRVEPEYPEEYRRARMIGIVVMQIAISEKGTVDRLAVIKSLAPEFDMAAVKAARTWKYKPAMQDGRAIPVLFYLTVNFKLE